MKNLDLKNLGIKNLGIIGLGKMGEAVLKGLQAHPTAPALQATRSQTAHAAQSAKDLDIVCHTDNLKLARECDVIVLAVKPYRIQEICELIGPAITKDKVVISVAAAITCAQMQNWLGGHSNVTRAMPNTPSQIRAGMTLLVSGTKASTNAKQATETIFQSVGETVWIEESNMDAATAISGCGPAYGYLVIEALRSAGVKQGLSADLAQKLAAQTLLGAAKMVLELNQDPALLRQAVATPGGMTEQGVLALENNGARKAFEEAVFAASRKASEMRNK